MTFFGTAERPGRYTRIEGSDGVGKTTQLELARQYSEANGLNALFVKEPGGSDFGMEMRELILHKKEYNLSPEVELMLFMADRAFLMTNVIVPALEEGRPVISDRGIESTLAYQAGAGKLGADTVMQIGKRILPDRYMNPDGVAVLVMLARDRQRRMRTKDESGTLDKIESRDHGYFDDVTRAYFDMVKLPHVTGIDASMTPEEVFNEVRPVLFGPDHA